MKNFVPNTSNQLRPLKILLTLSVGLMTLGIVGCEKKPPSQRAAVTLPIYTQGDAEKGKQQYLDNCEKCHHLQVGNNEKGPQLLRIYGSKSAQLTDYSYTDALKNSNLTWTAENLDKYIANPKQTIAGTRMRSEPVADAAVRQNIIAYLSTLR